MWNLAIVFFCILISTNISYAQITSTKMAKPTNSSQPYDGTENFLGENVSRYIGHDLYLKPLSKQLREYGYEGFVLDYKKDTESKSNIYNCCGAVNSNSKYEKMVGKYFTVLDVFKHPKKGFPYDTKYFLKLKVKDSKEIVYYEYGSSYETSFPFISVTYFEKLKRDLVGKQFIKNWRDLDNNWNDISSGVPVKIDLGSKWTCADITLEEKYYSIILILRNNKNQTIPIYLENYKDSQRQSIFLNEDAEKYKNKFGQEIWGKILSGKLAIGMSAEACELSWGRPGKINQTISKGSISEQWIYWNGENYLYFENGKLRTIQ